MSRVIHSPADTAEFESLASTSRLIARLLLRELDSEFLEELRSPVVAEAFVAAGGVLPDFDSEESIAELSQDYCQIFVGPANAISPFQSVWQEGRLDGSAAHSVTEFAAVIGFDVSQTNEHLADHLGVEFALLAAIYQRLASPDTNTTERSALDEIIVEFAERHLRWAVSVLDKAANQADSDFYRQALRMAKAFLDEVVL